MDMRIRTIFRCIILLAFDVVLMSSCGKKAVAQEADGAVLQSSAKAADSNEKLNLKPYPTVKWRNSVTIYQNRKKEDEKKEEPAVNPISDVQVVEKGTGTVTPEEPSSPKTTTSVPPSVDAKKDLSETPVPEVKSNDEEKRPSVVEKTPEPVVEEKTVVEEKKTAPVVETRNKAEYDEYERSLGSVSSEITIEEFEEDKSTILAIIKKLETVMKNKDYKTWLTYVDDASVKYWSTKKNLQKAQSRLPVKGLYLNNLQDYFKYVFIPSRNGRRVDEIRYETKETVKVVQVNDDSDTVYYYFKKSSNGAWKLHLPPISD